jgi:hypothetical protein
MKEDYKQMRTNISSSIDFLLNTHDQLAEVRDGLDYCAVVSGKGVAHDDISECLELLDDFILNIDSFQMYILEKLKEFK